MDQDLVSVWMEAFYKGELKACLNSQADQITPALAERARNIYENAYFGTPQDEPKAIAAILVAVALYERLGQHRNQIASQIDSLQIFYMRAKVPDDYKFVRDQIFPLQGYSDSMGELDLSFQLQVLAANCSFFAFKANDFDLTWLKTALIDILAVCQRAPGFEKTDAFANLVDLVANAAKRAITRVMPDEDRKQANESLRALAAAVNKLVPVDFVYRNDAEQTSRINYWLDQLNQGYGHA